MTDRSSSAAYSEGVSLPVVIFDLDGTLIDSDEALIDPFVALGIPRETVTFGHPIEQECERLGISVEAYVDAYDTAVVHPFAGAAELISVLETTTRWAVCSNKHPRSGRAELDRLGWRPAVALFTDAFDGRPKEVGPVLRALDIEADAAWFVGDTDHDRRCAADAGVEFAWAGWNPRVPVDVSGVRLSRPGDLLGLLGISDGRG